MLLAAAWRWRGRRCRARRGESRSMRDRSCRRKQEHAGERGDADVHEVAAREELHVDVDRGRRAARDAECVGTGAPRDCRAGRARRAGARPGRVARPRRCGRRETPRRSAAPRRWRGRARTGRRPGRATRRGNSWRPGRRAISSKTFGRLIGRVDAEAGEADRRRIGLGLADQRAELEERVVGLQRPRDAVFDDVDGDGIFVEPPGRQQVQLEVAALAAPDRALATEADVAVLVVADVGPRLRARSPAAARTASSPARSPASRRAWPRTERRPPTARRPTRWAPRGAPSRRSKAKSCSQVQHPAFPAVTNARQVDLFPTDPICVATVWTSPDEPWLNTCCARHFARKIGCADRADRWRAFSRDRPSPPGGSRTHGGCRHTARG